MRIQGKKKVVFVTPYWGPPRTGPEVFARYLWEAFSEDPGVEFHMVASGQPDAESVRHPRMHLVDAGGGSMAMYRNVARRALALMAELGGPGLLHVNNSNFHSSLMGSPWPVAGQVNDYDTSHFRLEWPRILRDYGLRRFVAMWRRTVLEGRFIRWQRLTLCNSEYTRDQVARIYRIKATDRLRVVYKAVDLSRFRRTAPREPVGGDSGRIPTVLFIGSNPFGKGLDVLVRAMPMLARPARLVVAGVDASQFASRFPGIKASGLGHGIEVSFLGLVPRSRIPQLLWDADVYCMPSRSEALGVALLEALAAGVPCVASDVGGIPEIARRFDSVRLVPSEDARGLADAISRQLQDRPREADVGLLSSVFGHQAMIDQVRTIYRCAG